MTLISILSCIVCLPTWTGGLFDEHSNDQWHMCHVRYQQLSGIMPRLNERHLVTYSVSNSFFSIYMHVSLLWPPIIINFVNRLDTPMEYACWLLQAYYSEHVIVVTLARGICLICMPTARGPQVWGLRAYISGKLQEHMLQVICTTSVHYSCVLQCVLYKKHILHCISMLL